MKVRLLRQMPTINRSAQYEVFDKQKEKYVVVSGLLVNALFGLRKTRQGYTLDFLPTYTSGFYKTKSKKKAILVAQKLSRFKCLRQLYEDQKIMTVKYASSAFYHKCNRLEEKTIYLILTQDMSIKEAIKKATPKKKRVPKKRLPQLVEPLPTKRKKGKFIIATYQGKANEPVSGWVFNELFGAYKDVTGEWGLTFLPTGQLIHRAKSLKDAEKKAYELSKMKLFYRRDKYDNPERFKESITEKESSLAIKILIDDYTAEQALKEVKESSGMSGLSTTTTLAQAKREAKKLAKKYGIEYVVIYDSDTPPYGYTPISIYDYENWGHLYKTYFSTEE